LLRTYYYELPAAPAMLCLRCVWGFSWAREVCMARHLFYAALAVTACVLFIPRPVAANSVTYSITDIGGFAPYSVANSGQTFAGTGFVGEYGPGQVDAAGSFAHLFGLEQSFFSASNLQVDISALAGQTINSASLQFLVLDGSFSPQNVSFSSYNTTGTLSYQWAPVPLGVANAIVSGGFNSGGVTGPLQQRGT